MKRNKFLALAMLCGFFLQMPASAHEIKDLDSQKMRGGKNSCDKRFNSDSAAKDSKFWEYIGKILLASVVIDTPHELLSYRFGQKDQFYENIAYASLIGIYRRRAKAKAKAVGLAISKIKEIIEKPFLDGWEQYRNFMEVEVFLKSVPVRHKQQIFEFWKSRKFDDVLVIPFTGKEVLDLLIEYFKYNDKDKELINKYSEEITNNVKLVVCAEFYSGDFDYDNHYACLTFAVSKLDHIYEINKILTNNDETYSMLRKKFLNLFECGFSSGKVSFKLCCEEEANKKN